MKDNKKGGSFWKPENMKTGGLTNKKLEKY